MSKLPDVAPLWRIRFDLIEKAGGPTLPGRKQLSGGEQFRVMFNFWALLFSPLYYLAKGMWRKALLFWLTNLTIITLISAVEAGDELHSVKLCANLAVAAWLTTRANIDYYRKMVLNDNGWW